MALKEPKSMAEIHAIRAEIGAETKGMNLHEKFVWMSKQAKKSKISLNTYVSPIKFFKKAS